MNIAKKYIAGLQKAYRTNGAGECWEHFESILHGVNEEDIHALQAAYPSLPDSLLQLLTFVDGTYWRMYANEKICFFFLGSDIEEYPYYLLSAKEMLADKDMAFKYYADYINKEYGDAISVDEKITDCAEDLCWLHFSDCMNNGGTSQLFIDFSPSEKGVKGQVVRFLHDPDELKVIANSFDAYLEMLIENGYNFIDADTVE